MDEGAVRGEVVDKRGGWQGGVQNETSFRGGGTSWGCSLPTPNTLRSKPNKFLNFNDMSTSITSPALHNLMFFVSHVTPVTLTFKFEKNKKFMS